MSYPNTKELLSCMRKVSETQRLDFQSFENQRALVVSALFAAAWNAQANEVCSRCGNLQLSWKPATGTVRRSLAMTGIKKLINWFHNPVRKLLQNCLREEQKEGESQISQRLENVADIILKFVKEKKDLIDDWIKDERQQRLSQNNLATRESLHKIFIEAEKEKSVFQDTFDVYKRHRDKSRFEKEMKAAQIESFFVYVQKQLPIDSLESLRVSMKALFDSIMHSKHSSSHQGTIQAASANSVPVGIPVNGEKSSKQTTSSDQNQKGLTKETEELTNQIEKEIISETPNVKWEDIAGLEIQKQAIQRAVVNPILRPELYTGLRKPPKGILLFGPPGTGKTLLGKAIATESKATFFSISASSIISKYYGESEKLIRSLFAVARKKQPSVIFVDEIDSFLGKRESNSSGQPKVANEFFVQMDGVGNREEDRVLVVGATNLPEELDEAARRRLATRLYIPLPDSKGREALIIHALKKVKYKISQAEIKAIVEATEGYSGSDLQKLCEDAAMGPIENENVDILMIKEEEIRPVQREDFDRSMLRIRASVNQRFIEKYEQWNDQFGYDLSSRGSKKMN